MQQQRRLTLALVRLILAAALLSAPLFLFAEGFQAKYIGRVAASNGTCVVLCLWLLRMLRKDQVEAAGRVLVYGLFALVGYLAFINGEPVHVNVINFVLVTLLAGSLLPRPTLLVIGAICALCMIAIALRQGSAESPEKLREMRLESIVQFLPTYLVIVGILWLRAVPTQPARDV